MTLNRFKSQGMAVSGHSGELSGGLFGLFDQVHGAEAIAAGIALRARINDLRSVPCDTLRDRRVTQVVGGRGGKKAPAAGGGKRVARPDRKSTRLNSSHKA